MGKFCDWENSKMKHNIDLIIDNEEWLRIDGYKSWEDSLNDVFDTCVTKILRSKKTFCVGLLLTDNIKIANLNRNFRGQNKPTNVLSFPEYEPEFFATIGTEVSATKIFLGDIAMSYEQIHNEAEEYGVNYFNRCSHLFVHGVLHLFGMDHVIEKEQEKMENMEIEILGKFNINNPYILEGERNAI